MRYEDLLKHPLEALIDLSKFIFDVEKIPFHLEEKITQVISENPQVYKPRKGKVGQNVHLFSQE